MEIKIIKLKGFTLIEVLVVIAIISILSAIAYPSYIEQVNRSKRAEGQAALVELAARLQEYYIDNTPPSFIGANLEIKAGGSLPYQVPADANNTSKYYDLSINEESLTSNYFEIKATPVNSLDKDIQFFIDSRGSKRHIDKKNKEIPGWP